MRLGKRKRAKRRVILSVVPVVALLLNQQTARSANLYWDTNGTTAGGSAGTTAAGTWGVDPFWNSSSTGAAGTISGWPGSGTTAVFAAGTNVTGSYSVDVVGTQVVDGITFEEGQVTLSGGQINLNTSVLSTSSTSATVTHTINSVISGTNGLSRNAGFVSGVSTSNLVLTAANTYSGLTTINTGVTRITNPGALGFAGGLGSGHETTFAVSSSTNNGLQLARLDLAGGINVVGEAVTITSGGGRAVPEGQLGSFSGTNTWSGDIRISGGSNNEGTGLASMGSAAGATLVINGATISNPAGYSSTTIGAWWAKTGAGTLVLRNTTGLNAGSIRLINGTLVVESDGALGPSPVGSFGITDIFQSVVFNSISGTTPTLAFAGNVNYTTGRFVRLSGTSGMNGMGELASIGGDNTFAGEVSIGPSSTFGASTGSLELSALWGSATTARLFSKVGPGELIISSTNSGANGLTGTSAGTNNQFGITAGTFVVAAGQLTLRNNAGTGGTGSIEGGIGFQVNPGATLSLDNSLGVNVSRVGTGAPILVAGGEVKLIGNTATTVNQDAGNLAVAGFSTFTVSQPTNTNGATTTFALGTLNRSNRGTALLRGIDNTNTFVALSGTLHGASGASGTPGVSILPEAVGDSSATGAGSDFVTIEGAFARPLTASEYQTLTSGLTDTFNTTVAASSTISADTSVNSLKISGGNTLSIATGTRLQLKSVALLGVGSGASSIAGGTLQLDEQSIFTDPDTAVTSLIGTPGEAIVTVPAGSALAISSRLEAGDGMTKSGRGTLTLSGNSTYTGVTTLNAGVVEVSQNGSLGDSNFDVVLNGGDLRVLSTHSTARNFQLQSLVDPANGIEVAGGETYTINGVVSGSGQLTKKGAGDLVLTSTNNTYVGVTNILAGQVTAPAPGVVSSSQVNLEGGALHISGDGTYLNQISINNATGGIRVDPGVTAVFGSPTASTSSTQGRFSGSANLLIDGGGILNPIGNNTYTGDNVITNGSTLRYTRSQGRGVPPTLRATHFDLDNGIVQIIGQTTNSNVGTTGITTLSANAGVTLRAGGGTFDIQQGAAAGSYSVSFLGSITGSGDLIKVGAGTTLSIGTNNTYTGRTRILDGVVRITGDTGLGAVPVAFVADSVQIATGAKLNVVGNLTINANRGIQLLGGVGTVLINSNTVTLAAPVSETVFSAFTREGTGTMNLNVACNYSGTTTIVGGGNGVGATNASVLRIGVHNALPIGTALALNTLSATGTAVFDHGTGATSFNQTVASLANIGPAGSSSTVTNSGTTTATFTLNNTSTNTWSGKFTGANLQVDHNTPARLVLTGSGNNFGGLNGAGSTTIGSGTIGITATAGHWRQGTLTIFSNSTIRTTVSGAGGGFAGGQSNGTNKATTLVLGVNSKFDLADNKLITASGIGTFNGSNYTSITGLVASGRGDGSWNGTDITTSMTDATSGAGYTSLGVAASEVRGIGATATDTWGGQIVTGSDTLVMYTYGGDADLSGSVDADDYGQIDFNALIGGILTGWYNGDFDYSGSVDADDYGIIDFVVGIQGLPFVSGAGEMTIAAVPEPGSIVGLLTLGGAIFARRRKR